VNPHRRGRGAGLGAERGETLVEFAVAAVLFMMCLFGTIEFGLGVWQYNMVSNLAQEGARLASVCGPTKTLTNAACDVSSVVQGRALGMNVTVTFPLGNPSTIAPGNLVAVKVAHDFGPDIPLLPTGTIRLQSTSQMIVAR
jgi:Flp pilus assembly protein TadG